ncbi:MAG TPA: hypothetical protein VNQ76_20680 [Planctomicrobium sp.]|nr:hypothetical protein [Planctomicrobium sp.]
MERNRESASLLIRFLDSFLHERNIKWMLGIGTLILLGSSLRLVSMHWGDYTPFWKYGILLAYTAVIFAASQISYFRLGLLRTGTVLMALTVALIPVSFYALHWVHPEGPFEWSTIAQQVGLISLVGVNFVLSAAATHRIFVHFLRKPQWTFEFSYLALSLAGAVVPAAVSGLSQSWSYGIVTVLWLLFTVGTLKVNRHVFWLNEEEHRPRIFSFFPILLLGTQFLGLFAISLSQEIEMQWWGLGCALIAIPVLLTADTVTKVFQQRTGNLVRPLPSSIVAPLVVGLILCAMGLGFAATGIPRLYALVPTAGLIAMAMGVVARRTGSQAFTWIGIGCVLIAYQFSPLFFLEAAKFVLQQGAVAVQESRLPYAFYGLTYLPVLLIFTVASPLLQRSRLEVFAGPLRHAAIVLACLLLVAGFGHPKATFPVSVAMVGVFAMQIICFRERRLLIPANLALIGTAWGFPAFQMMLFETPTEPISMRFLMALVGLLQFVPGRWVDGWSLRLGNASQTSTVKATVNAGLCQQFSLAVTFLTGVSCCLGPLMGIEAAPPLMTGLLLGGLLVAHAMLSMELGIGLACVVFLNLLAGLHWMSFPFSWTFTLFCLVILLTAQWTIGQLLRQWPTSRISQAFSEPLSRFGMVSQFLVLIGGILPVLISSQWMLHEQSSLFWIASGVMAGLCYVAGWRTEKNSCVLGGFLVLLLLPSAMFVQQVGNHAAGNWLPLIWSISAIAQLATLQMTERYWIRSAPLEGEEESVGHWLPSQQLETLIAVLLGSVAIGTLFFLNLPARLAAVVALAGLMQKRSDGRLLVSHPVLACLANWQALCLLIHLLTGETGTLGQISNQQFFTVLFPVSLFAALSVLVIEFFLCSPMARQMTLSGKLVLSEQRVLMLLLSTVMLVTQSVNPTSEISSTQVMAVIAAFFCLGLSQLVRGCREQNEEAVWTSLVIGVFAVGYLALFQLIDITLGWGMYSLLTFSLILWLTGKFTSGTDRLKIMSGPFLTTAYWMPLLVVLVGIVLHATNGDNIWKGANSLALLLASAFYFFQGMEQNRVRNWIMFVGILNIAFAMLWNELQWHDAQLFLVPIGASVLLLVELLRREIPESFHDPLRYIGALIILTSPTFEIIGGSWLHLLSLMILSVIIVLLAIGLRVRALVYTGTAFLIADLIAMVVRGGFDHPNLLWGAGVILGLGVIGLAAYCEHHREKLMSRIRLISAELETWS